VFIPDWATKFPGGVTICDKDLIIVYMNNKALKIFEKDGGAALIGTSLVGCHSERSNVIMRQILEKGTPNVYTIEKNGVKKLIYQAPWSNEDGIAGLVELSLELPSDMPHFLRG
jgi:hypothetical protein